MRTVVGLSEPRRQHVDHDRVAANYARRLHTVEGRVFGEPQDLHAVLEDGAEPSALIQSAGLELGEVDDDGYRRLALASREPCEFSDELAIRE
jgi:hypothetical protein